MLEALENFLQPLLPQYAKEGKVVLTVAIGCTGGRHRSVAMVEALVARLASKADSSGFGEITGSHRDIDRGG